MELKEIKERLSWINPDHIVPDHDVTGHYYIFIPTRERFPSVTTKAGILESPHLKKWAAGLAVDHINKHWEQVASEKGVSDELRKSAVMAYNDILEDAGDIGTEGHKVIEDYCKSWLETGKKPSDIKKFILGEDYRLFAIARSFERFVHDFEAVPIASEMLVANDKDKYAGTLDILMMLTKILDKTDKFCGENNHTWERIRKDSKIHKCKYCKSKMRRVFTLVDIKTSNSVDKIEYAMQGAAYWRALWDMVGLKTEEVIIVQVDKHKQKYKTVRILNKYKCYLAFRNVGKVYDFLSDGQSKLVPYTPKTQIFYG